MLIPYPHQEEAIRIGTDRNLLCADVCGLGKTLIGIEIARNIQETRYHPILVVCTKGARLQWSYAIEDQLSNGLSNPAINILDEIDDYTFCGNGTDDDGWYIIHYAALRKLKRGDLLTRTYFGAIILDEAHRIKGPRSKQTEGVKRLVSYRKIALTATEMEKAPHDMWSILNFLYPDRFRSFHAFKARYVRIDKHPYFGYETVVGPKNTAKLAKMIANIYVRRTKEEVRDDLPPLTETKVPIKMTPQLLRGYTDVETAGDILVEVDGLDEELLIKNVLSKIMVQRQLTSNGLMKFTSPKIEYVVDYVQDNPDESILIFTVFRDTARVLSQRLKAPLVMGQEPDVDVQQLRPKVLVGTIKKLGESYDLPWMDTAIFVDCEWSSVLQTQARDRIHRINITSPKQALYLYHPGTVDELVFEALGNKWDNLKIVREYIARYKGGL